MDISPVNASLPNDPDHFVGFTYLHYFPSQQLSTANVNRNDFIFSFRSLIKKNKDI